MKKGIMVIQDVDNDKNHLVRFARESIYADDVLTNLNHKFVFEYNWDIGTTAAIRETLVQEDYDLVLLTPTARHYASEISGMISDGARLLALGKHTYQEVTAKRARPVFFS